MKIQPLNDTCHEADHPPTDLVEELVKQRKLFERMTA
jgi:hypothetical protein